jgi:hypothetical protein
MLVNSDLSPHVYLLGCVISLHSFTSNAETTLLSYFADLVLSISFFLKKKKKKNPITSTKWNKSVVYSITQNFYPTFDTFRISNDQKKQTNNTNAIHYTFILLLSH